jgi:dihydrodipicolinate synthase/N-acetylneuraminate lyase
MIGRENEIDVLQGVYPILAMPFDAVGRIDVEALQREVEFMVSAGVHGVGVALASEVPMLSEAERDLALRTVVDQARGRVRVVMNTSAAGTDLAVLYTRRAQDLGANAVMVLPPPPATISADEMVAYFCDIAAATRLPIFMQDVPTSPVPPGLAVRIAASREHAWYLKAETPPTVPRVAEVVAARRAPLRIFGGAGGYFFVQEMRRGAVGTMPGSAIPEVFVRVWNLFQAGHVTEAAATLAHYGTLLTMLAQGFGLNFYLAKEVLHLRGVFSRTNTRVRRPATAPDELALRELNELMELCGLK